MIVKRAKATENWKSRMLKKMLSKADGVSTSVPSRAKRRRAVRAVTSSSHYDTRQSANFTGLGWLAGKPDYPQELKVLEEYEKISEKRNI